MKTLTMAEEVILSNRIMITKILETPDTTRRLLLKEEEGVGNRRDTNTVAVSNRGKVNISNLTTITISERVVCAGGY